MTFRYPDKPALSLRYGSPIPRGEYLCQFKPDGERCIIRFEAGQPLQIVSRFNRPLADAEQARSLAEPIRARLEGLGWNEAVLDAEFTCPRRGAKWEGKFQMPARFWVFDILSLGGDDWRELEAKDRWDSLAWLFYQNVPGVPEISSFICPGGSVDGDPKTFLEIAYKTHRLFDWARCTEGVVLKRTDSKLTGSTVKSALNPGWIKVKW